MYDKPSESPDSLVQMSTVSVRASGKWPTTHQTVARSTIAQLKIPVCPPFSCGTACQEQIEIPEADNLIEK